MANPAVARVLDRTRAEQRARVADVAAMGLLVVGVFTLLFDMYSAGYTAATEAAAVFARDARFVRMLIEMAITATAFCWIAFRLVTHSARSVGG